MADLIAPFPLDPPTSTDPSTFDVRADSAWTHMADEVIPGINALPATLAASIGTGVIPYKFKTATSGDPGAGGLWLNNGTQTAATGAGLDLLDALGQDVTGRLARIGVGTSTVKGELTLTKVGDGRVWLNFQVMSAASPSGYRSLVLADGLGSSASPFAADDDVVVSYVPTGDQGIQGPALDVAADFVAYDLGVVSSVSAGRVTRALSTVERNRYGWAFSSYQLTLPAGDYMVWATAGGSGIANNWPVLRNVTDSVDLVTGVAGYARQVTDLQFWGAGFITFAPFTLAAQKVVRLDHIVTNEGGGANYDTGGARGGALAIWKRN